MLGVGDNVDALVKKFGLGYGPHWIDNEIALCILYTRSYHTYIHTCSLHIQILYYPEFELYEGFSNDVTDGGL